jgi:hypothetical protein
MRILLDENTPRGVRRILMGREAPMLTCRGTTFVCLSGKWSDALGKCGV